MKCYWSYFGNLACIILLIAGILFCPPKADAQQNVRIGYVDMPNFFTAVSRNSYSGYAYCYMEMLSGYADWNYTYVPGTWEKDEHGLAIGDGDDFSDTDWLSDFKDTCHTPKELSDLLKETAKELADGKMPNKPKAFWKDVMADCENWSIDDEETEIL